MASLQIKNIPEAVVEELRNRASQFHRNLEDEAAATLVHAVMSGMRRTNLSASELLDRARRVRDGHPDVRMTEEFLRMAKNFGRA